MARISTYPVQPNPDGSDILLGTDASGGTNATKNFRIRDVSAASIAYFLANTNWKFEEDILVGPFEKSSVFLPAGGGNNVAWSNITALRFQTVMGNNTDAHPYLEYLLSNDPATGQPSVGNIIKLHDRNDLSSFGVFTFDALTLVSGTIYEATLTYIKGTGATQQHHIYGVDLDPTETQDKTEIFSQPIPSSTWTINHNMGKFPSVSVVNNNNILMYGDTSYQDKNNLTITFSAGFSGKAYLN